MYDFLLSEVYWMEVIISACITGVVTIIGAVIVYQVKLAKILDNTTETKSKCSKLSTQHSNLSKEHSDLSKEHSGLSKEHTGLSKEHSTLLSDSRQLLTLSTDVKATVGNINKIVSDEKTKQEFRYNNLTDKQKDISQSIVAIELMHSEMKRLQSEQLDLSIKNEQLKQENAKLRVILQNERTDKKTRHVNHMNPTHEFDDDELER